MKLRNGFGQSRRLADGREFVYLCWPEWKGSGVDADTAGAIDRCKKISPELKGNAESRTVQPRVKTFQIQECVSYFSWMMAC